MSSDPEQPSNTPPAPASRSPAWLAVSAVVLAILVTVLTIGVVGWRWYHVRFPNAALFIRGEASAEGTEVTVADEQGVQIFTGRITEQNQYQLVVLVEQGIYIVIARQDGKVLVRDRIYVPNGYVLLQVKPPATQPTQPATGPAAPPAVPEFLPD